MKQSLRRQPRRNSQPTPTKIRCRRCWHEYLDGGGGKETRPSALHQLQTSPMLLTVLQGIPGKRADVRGLHRVTDHATAPPRDVRRLPIMLTGWGPPEESIDHIIRNCPRLPMESRVTLTLAGLLALSDDRADICAERADNAKRQLKEWSCLRWQVENSSQHLT
ncbi:hypothetical protein HPB50_009685 [Hyalomma asiaticum]|uniref:Uncharacterized protein n=1 Tax=Hyalomma asiaticum TaxID=266040 RepID=A0ACB7TEW4_HYAAI|nr:hypothetical protein HPB50_009685 [Hyalomma asiaticum]